MSKVTGPVARVSDVGNLALGQVKHVSPIPGDNQSAVEETRDTEPFPPTLFCN